MLEIGSLVDGKYRILRVVGKGGMSVVYQAVNEKANKIWAIKEVRKDGVQNYEVVKQNLIVETELLKRFNHPNLPSIIDVIDGDGTFLIVMDYIEGNSLSKALENGAQSQDDVIEWSKQLCDVLGYLHSRKPPIIYRDMKPANVMLKPDGKISLIDFGTAREFKSSSVEDTTCLGTQGYAAPEQYGGHGQTDARTDIYCLGATMYHLVTGHNPSVYPYEMRPIRQWNPALSSGLEKIILKCTQRNPDDRYQSCAELLYAIDHYRDLDIETERKQNVKWKLFITSLILTLVMTLGAVGFSVATASATSQTYASLLKKAKNMQSPSMDDASKKEVVDIYLQAINKVDPSNVEAYKDLLDFYISDKKLDTDEYKVLQEAEANNRDLLKEKSEEKYINDFVLPLADSLFFSYISKTNTNGEGIKTSHRWYDTALNSKANISDSNRKKAELLDKIAKNYGDVGTIPTGSTDITYNGRQYCDDLVSLIDPNMVKESNILITLRMYNFVASEMYKGVSKYWKTSSITEEEYKAAFEKLKAETDKLTQSGDYKVNEGMLSVYVKSIDDFYQKAEREGLGTTNTSQEGSGK